MRSGDTQQGSEVETCDLCIVGAGIAGVNALYAASRYLTQDQRVILIDKRPAPGGMWTDTYSYVRLHQPHPMFTAGDIEWTIDRAPSYLASKPEVLDHFHHCIETLRSKLDLVERYSTTYLEHHEVSPDEDYEVDILCHSASGDAPLRIKATKCVKAFGFRIPENPPLSFSSGRIRSVSPHCATLLGDELKESDKPVYVVGGGKTGMDTAHALITRFPQKEVHLIAGAGTAFLNRNQSFPEGFGRWWKGKTGLARSLDLARRFDGENEGEVFDYFRKTYALSLDGDCEEFVFGLLSEEELERISNGLRTVTMDYIADVVDAGGETTLICRGGKTQAVEPGSWFVNCTGYVMKETFPYEPYVSEQGLVVSVQPTSAVHFLTTFASYFLVHLLYLGKLQSLPLYELNYQDLVAKNKKLVPFAATAHMLYNTMLIMEAVPGNVMSDCGLDFDRWFPLPRRLLGVWKLKRNRGRYLGHFRKTLDRVRERYDIRCGVLEKSERYAT